MSSRSAKTSLKTKARAQEKGRQDTDRFRSAPSTPLTEKAAHITATGPKYMQLKGHLLYEMTTGRLKPGSALPSEQELADGWDVARTTVRQALAELESEGLIDR